MKRLQLFHGLGTRFAVATLALAASRVQADPPVVSPEDIQQAARVALAQGVAFLKQRAEKDEQGWIIPPGQNFTRRVIGSKQVALRYREVEVDVPVYEYKQVVTFVQGSPGDPPRKVVTQQPVRKTGTRKETRLVVDPKGSIEKTTKHPVYEKGDNTVFWYPSTIGDNALAVCALRRAGVPDDDPVMSRMLSNLKEYLGTYRAPDQTWNLAWLVAALAPVQDKDAIAWTEALVGRLLDGQITDGAARGLWGPMSFHPRLLSVLARDYLAIAAEIPQREAKLKQKKTKANEDAVEEAKFALRLQQDIVERWMRRALRFGFVEVNLVWEAGADPLVHFAGSSDFIYNQRSADLESTWAALHALAVAAENKRLPQQSARPVLKRLLGTSSTVGLTTVPSELPMPVLARAANALAALQPADGRWTECNFHQPVTDFDTFASVLPVPVDPKSFPPLASPVTPLSAAQGIGALESIGRAVGMDKLGKFQRNFATGSEGRRAEMESLIKTAWANPAKRPTLAPSSYDLFLALARPAPVGGTAPNSALPEDQLTQLLILAGNPTGRWATVTVRTPHPFIASSTRERYAVLKGFPNRVWNGGRSPVEMNKAHIFSPNVLANSPSLRRDAEAHTTAVAVYFLAGRVENPDAALAELETHPELPELRKNVDSLLMGKAVTVAPAPAAPATPPASPADAPPATETKTAPEGQAPAKPVETKPKPDESF
jgi:hypothetical protein